MQSEINTILEIRDLIAQHGQALIIGIAVIVVGLIELLLAPVIINGITNGNRAYISGTIGQQIMQK